MGSGSIIFGNIRGLYSYSDLTKPDMLFDLADLHDSFMICLTETHLNKNILDLEIVKEGWTIFRTDRRNRLCGGTAIILSEQLSFSTSCC